MLDVTRRQFLAGSAALAGAGALTGHLFADDQSQAAPPQGTDQVVLGNTGLKLSRLGIGTGTKGGSEQLAMGSDKFVEMVHYGLDRGITFLDTADMYNTHVFLRLAIQGINRDRYFLLSKTRAKTAEMVRADVDRFLRVLRCRHIDTLLMHCMTSPNWPTEQIPVMEEMLKLKEEGKIRSVGVSIHGLEPLIVSPEVDWCEVQMVRFNPFGNKMDGKPSEEIVPIVQKLKQTGRGILAMKVFGEGTLANAEQRYESIKWNLKSGLADAMTVGFSSKEQIDDVLAMIERAGKELA